MTSEWSKYPRNPPTPLFRTLPALSPCCHFVASFQSLSLPLALSLSRFALYRSIVSAEDSFANIASYIDRVSFSLPVAISLHKQS